jgi:chaperonin GroEL (HSP60 family)
LSFFEVDREGQRERARRKEEKTHILFFRSLFLQLQSPTGGLRDSFLVDGVAFRKTFSYAGFEMQPKRYENPKVLALNIELELKAEKDNAEVRLDDPGDYQAVVDAEW